MDYNDFNFQLKLLETTIYNDLENSKMPLGAVYYLIKDIFNTLDSQYIASVNSYSLNQKEKLEEKQEENSLVE